MGRPHSLENKKEQWFSNFKKDPHLDLDTWPRIKTKQTNISLPHIISTWQKTKEWKILLPSTYILSLAVACFNAQGAVGRPQATRPHPMIYLSLTDLYYLLCNIYLPLTTNTTKISMKIKIRHELKSKLRWRKEKITVTVDLLMSWWYEHAGSWRKRLISLWRSGKKKLEVVVDLRGLVFLLFFSMMAKVMWF